MKKSALALITASMLALSACGGGGGGGLSSEDQEVADNISKSLLEQQDEQVFAFDKADADCIGEGMVEDIGVDELKEYGFLKEDGSVDEDITTVEMSTDDAETMTDTMFDCTDLMAMVEKSVTGQLAGQDPAVKECVNDAVTEERVRSSFVALFSGDEKEAQESLIGPIMECATQAPPAG